MFLDIARRLLVAGISNFPHTKNLGWFHSSLGSVAAEQNDANTARACYDRALDATAPHRSLSLLLEYAGMEGKVGDPRLAVRLYERALKMFPKEERYINLSVCIIEQDFSMALSIN